jgi:hypothetical protein
MKPFATKLPQVSQKYLLFWPLLPENTHIHTVIREAVHLQPCIVGASKNATLGNHTTHNQKPELPMSHSKSMAEVSWFNFMVTYNWQHATNL